MDIWRSKYDIFFWPRDDVGGGVHFSPNLEPNTEKQQKQFMENTNTTVRFMALEYVSLATE